MQENEKIEEAPVDSTGGDQHKILRDKKDIWDIMGAVGRLLGSVVAASAMVFVAIVGSKIDQRTAEWDRTFRSEELLTRRAELQSSREFQIPDRNFLFPIPSIALGSGGVQPVG